MPPTTAPTRRASGSGSGSGCATGVPRTRCTACAACHRTLRGRTPTAATSPSPGSAMRRCCGRSADRTVLTDPHFRERASPVPFAGPRRLVPLPTLLAALPRIDVVVLSHNHYDHLDRGTVHALAAQPGGPRPLLSLRVPWRLSRPVDPGRGSVARRDRRAPALDRLYRAPGCSRPPQTPAVSGMTPWWSRWPTWSIDGFTSTVVTRC